MAANSKSDNRPNPTIHYQENNEPKSLCGMVFLHSWSTNFTKKEDEITCAICIRKLNKGY